MSSFSLKSVFEAVHQAVVDAAAAVENASWTSLRDRYFTQADDGTYTPKIVRMTLPHVDQGQMTQQPFELPLFALTKHHSLAVDTMKVEFDVELRGLDKPDDSLMAAMPRGLLSRNPTAKVSITFKGGDAHEGVMLLNDKILKSFPR
jgi:hypothetical protein